MIRLHYSAFLDARLAGSPEIAARRAQLAENTAYFRKELKGNGLTVMGHYEIINIISEPLELQFSAALKEKTSLKRSCTVSYTVGPRGL